MTAIPRPAAARTRGKNNFELKPPGAKTDESARRLLSTGANRIARLTHTHRASFVLYMAMSSGEEVVLASPTMRGAVSDALLDHVRTAAEARHRHDEYAAMPEDFELVDTETPDHPALYRPATRGSRMFDGKRRRTEVVESVSAPCDADIDLGEIADDEWADMMAGLAADGQQDKGPGGQQDEEQGRRQDVAAALERADRLSLTSSMPGAVTMAPADGLAALADMARSFRHALACIDMVAEA